MLSATEYHAALCETNPEIVLGSASHRDARRDITVKRPSPQGATMKLLIGGLSLAALLFLAADASAEAVNGFARGYKYPTYNAPGVPLLDSFYFRYSDTDHNVASLAARPQSNGQIMLVLADKNNDDEYYYSVEHKRRSGTGIITGSFVDFCTPRSDDPPENQGNCLYPLTSPGTGYIFALRGFRFYFRNGDHHVDQIGIMRVSNGVRTYFNDRNDDDPYVVYVDYAWLPTSMIEQTGQLTGSDDGGGVQRAFTNANRAVITGFRMDYLNDGDHELQEVGVLTRASDIQVWYGDGNGDDDFSYHVNYAVVR